MEAGIDESLRARRLLDRAGFGPRPGDLDALRAEGPEAWLARALADPEPADRDLARRLSAFASWRDPRWHAVMAGSVPEMGSGGRPNAEQRKERSQRARALAQEMADVRFVRAVHGRHGLREVMIDFWANHFNVFGAKNVVGGLIPEYQRSVLERHALGRFEDLLGAVAHSPAMLVYLDNWTSTAPRASSRSGRRGGINENYARELLELHTLGADGGYDQQDVIETARVFTGWTLASRSDPRFDFKPFLHDDGAKRVLGEPVRGRGEEQGERLLRRLARHPATAHHLARKLVRRFVADAPPPALVDRTARTYLDHEGEIRPTLATILRSREFADPAQRKLKTPFRFAASAVRAGDGTTEGGLPLRGALHRLGELPWFWRTPDGPPETADAWLDPGAMLERMSFAFWLGRGYLRGTRVDGLGEAAPPRRDLFAVGRLRRGEAAALAWADPEFQWTA